MKYSRIRKQAVIAIIISLLITLLVLHTAHAQCDQNFRPAAVIEWSAPFGVMVTGGVIPVAVPFTFMVGVRGKPIPQPDAKNANQPAFNLYPIAQVAYRVAGGENFGVHAYAEISKRPEVGAYTNIGLGDWAAVRIRGGYDRTLSAGIGLLLIFP